MSSLQDYKINKQGNIIYKKCSSLGSRKNRYQSGEQAVLKKFSYVIHARYVLLPVINYMLCILMTKTF